MTDGATYEALIAIAGGLLLDLVLGDPEFPYHPVRLMGALAHRAEAFFRPRLQAAVAGVSTWAAVMVGTLGAGALFLAAAGATAGGPGRAIGGAVLVWASVAARDLAVHAGKVRAALERGNLAEARRRVGMLVGRDTAILDEGAVARAAVESVAESFVDGIAAPLFWAALLGPLGALGYRAVNTMDSIFGHKNERYLRFGRAAARLDDAAGYIPARLAAVLACAAAPIVGGSIGRSFRIFLRDRLKHESPNSAHGESAFAGALGLVLGGPTVYGGMTTDKPYLGGTAAEPRGRPCVPADIRRAVRLMAAATVLWTLFLIGLRLGILALH